VADEIARAKVPCSVIVVDSPGGKPEAVNMTFKNAAVLEKAGVLVAFHTDDWITDSRVFFRSAALGVRGGMTRAGALKALTLAGAQMLDLGDRIGSLETGKDADFIILNSDPLSVYSKVLETWVEGIKVFDRSDPKDYLYAVGGYGAGHDQSPYLCCFEHPEGP
jgi:imidazolonepropionase-like amidohydrolase